MNKYDSSVDSILIDQFLNGDGKAFEDLVNKYRGKLYSYLYQMVGDSEAAKDLFQDVIVKVLKYLPKYEDKQKFSNWLFRIAHNTAISLIQRHKRKLNIISENTIFDSEIEFSGVLADESFSPETLMNKKELQQILKSAIQRLPIEQKEILILREFSEMPFKEIAHMLDCSINTVLGRMRYALLNLRKIIQVEIGGESSDVL